MSKPTATPEDLAELRAMFPPNTAVPMILRHVSRSGMTRTISVLDPDSLRDVSYLVARALGYSVDRDRGGLRVGGCGMDMGFHVAYSLARVLYGAPNGPAYTCNGNRGYDLETYATTPGPRCYSNDHTNERTPEYTPGRLHSDAGYALHRTWL